MKRPAVTQSLIKSTGHNCCEDVNNGLFEVFMIISNIIWFRLSFNVLIVGSETSMRKSV